MSLNSLKTKYVFLEKQIFYFFFIKKCVPIYNVHFTFMFSKFLDIFKINFLLSRGDEPIIVYSYHKLFKRP